MSRRTIAAVTSSRADYGHLYWTLRELEARPEVDLRLIAMGPHLSPEFGRTVSAIEADGFTIAERVECLLSSDTDVGMAKGIGVGTLGFADVLGRDRPDLLLLIADRFEMLAPACAGLSLRIPMAHIEGGEHSEGAIDNAVRNALTVMSHLHFTSTEAATRRVIAMGEEPWRVHRVGAASLDHLRRSELLGRAELERRLEIDLSEPPLVVACHPVTLAADPTAEAGAVFEALERVDHPVVFCFPNADAGSRSLIERAEAFARTRPGVRLFANLAPVVYWSLLSCAAAMVGNSSSGIMESASLQLPAVNVGTRQQGRERARNVIDAPAECDAIIAAIRRALSRSFRESFRDVVNPYGDGDAARRIAAVLTDTPIDRRLLIKRAAQPHESLGPAPPVTP